MQVSARFTEPFDPNANPDAPRQGELIINGQKWFTVLPPQSGELRGVYDRWLASGEGSVQAYVAPPAPEPVKPDYSKAQLFSAMTDEEFGLYEYISLSQPGRERAIFENTTAIQPTHSLYPKFEQLVLQAYGERGPDLLEAAAIA